MRTVIYDHLPEEAMALRLTVFADEQGFRDDVDEIDGIATHLVVFDEAQTPIATCRIFPAEDGDTYLLGRFCVAREYRGRCVGLHLVKAVEAYALSKGARRLALHSQCQAKDFYTKAGFTAYGDIEEEQGCPHIWMEKALV